MNAPDQQRPRVSLAHVADEFGLHGLAAVRFHKGAVGAWQVSAGGELFSMKVLSLNAPAWELDLLPGKLEFELAALAAGVDAVEPLWPRAPSIAFATEIEGYYVWLHRWFEADPNVDPPTPMSSWLGGTLALLHGLAATDADLSHDIGLHPIADWSQWITDAETKQLPWAPTAATWLPAIERAMSLVRDGFERLADTRRVSHRDVNPPNVLVGPGGIRLCDFGYVGPVIPWLEVVGTALSFDDPGVIPAYLAAGGRSGPMSAEALSGWFGSKLMWLAFNVWLSLGHRDVPEERRREATEVVPSLGADLLRSLDDVEVVLSRVFYRQADVYS